MTGGCRRAGCEPHAGRRRTLSLPCHYERRDAIADLYSRDAGADFNDFAGAVRERNGVLRHRPAEVLACDDREVAEIE